MNVNVVKRVFHLKTIVWCISIENFTSKINVRYEKKKQEVNASKIINMDEIIIDKDYMNGGLYVA